ncbi:MAG: C13 family peptidase [Rehaibacterium terrae]|uniref:C13 family peptidase n=1 Tax=Rehaibacterium terrae TaxID=1341696 RepID=UPI00391C94A7
MSQDASPTRLIRQGLSLGLLRRPRDLPAIAGPGAFFAAFALFALLGLGWDSATTAPPRHFDWSAITDYALYAVLALLAGWSGTAVLRRPSLWLTLAALIVLASLPSTLVLLLAGHSLPDSDWRDLALEAGFVLVGLAYLARSIGYLAAGAGLVRRIGAWSLCALLWLLPTWLYPVAPFWYTQWDQMQDEADHPQLDLQALLEAQDALLDRALADLSPQRPGRIDLYVLGFAGDGHESVFRNEVDYLQQLFSQRFDAAGRTLGLINHPQTFGHAPLATVANLQLALHRIGDRMDRDEDILLLFLTTHGSEEHELLVQLGPLPMQQLRPHDLRAALDVSGIRHRVVVVSACFAGGFIDALRDPDTLVIAAARADRPSFGCGEASEITWFGRAFLVEALNRTHDFVAAFELASELIAGWEHAQGFERSHPQIAVGERIGARLAAWRDGITPGPPVAFVPTVPTVPAPRGEAPAAARQDL